MVYFNSFPWSYYIIYSKIVWDYGVYFNEGRSVAMSFMTNDFAYSLQIEKWVARGKFWYTYDLI